MKEHIKERFGEDKTSNIVSLCKKKYGFDFPSKDPITFIHELKKIEYRLSSKRKSLYIYTLKDVSYFYKSGDFKRRKHFLSKMLGTDIKIKSWEDFCFKLDNIYNDFIVLNIYRDTSYLYNEIKMHSFISSSRLEGVEYKRRKPESIDTLLKKYQR
ncbi:hypothetical protein [Aeromonas schubertii]|uniref:hypothetical protein n=1 Tax=Aeromonas schubertii TaxID=652 RepID=UPI0010A82200|nr:hypothetical protein [Aeromonas schubertii]QCG47124.1 hypothetical protein E2P79_03995 [Aeromonas schubertii]